MATKSEYLTIRVTTEQKKRIEVIADMRQWTMSKTASLLVEAGLRSGWVQKKAAK